MLKLKSFTLIVLYGLKIVLFMREREKTMNPNSTYIIQATIEILDRFRMKNRKIRKEIEKIILFEFMLILCFNYLCIMV
jgi:hypothetical protein